MKRIALALAMLAGVFVAHADTTYTPKIDGSWFDSACFGCPGDTVINEVIQQNADFDEAAQADEAGRTVDTLKECVRLSLFSYDKAGYLLELGHLSGDNSFYQQAADAARAAIAVPLNPKWLTRKGENVPEKSHRLGKKWLAVALKHLPAAQ